nr:hypothetical protein FEE99_03430 [Pseudomonas sp. ef1]
MIQADSFLLHKKSKTPPKKTGFSPCLGGLRRSRTLSQLKKYTSHALFCLGETLVARGFIPVRLRSSRIDFGAATRPNGDKSPRHIINRLGIFVR